MYEMSVNKRDTVFFAKLCQVCAGCDFSSVQILKMFLIFKVISMLPKLNELQLRNIRSLKPSGMKREFKLKLKKCFYFFTPLR